MLILSSCDQKVTWLGSWKVFSELFLLITVTSYTFAFLEGRDPVSGFMVIVMCGKTQAVCENRDDLCSYFLCIMVRQWQVLQQPRIEKTRALQDEDLKILRWIAHLLYHYRSSDKAIVSWLTFFPESSFILAHLPLLMDPTTCMIANLIIYSHLFIYLTTV